MKTFFLVEATRLPFSTPFFLAAQRRTVSSRQEEVAGDCCAAAQRNKRAAALLKSWEFSTVCAEKKRECSRLREHSLSGLQLRSILFRFQRSRCRAANLWCRPPRRSLSSARASAVRVRRMTYALLKGSPCGKGSCQRQLTEGIERWSAAETVQMRFTPGNLTYLPHRPRA